ncbi:MAG: iron ABC transporter permease [Pseudomonadota bacterium]
MESGATCKPVRARRAARSGSWVLTGIATALILFCTLPHLAVFLAAIASESDTLAHLYRTVLGGFVANTLALVALVGLGSFLIGAGAAWLVVMTEFPGRRLLEVLLVIPLAFPAYVLAYAYTHILDHPGIVQTTLRAITGWGPRDYWFPEVRSLGGAASMLTLVLYPYVYLLARAAFLAQSATAFSAARALGRAPLQAFMLVSLPMARPAIAAGVLLTAMETIADFGTVSYFGVQTFATGIYTSWFSMADRTAAAQLALGLLAFALLLALSERYGRGQARHDQGRKREPVVRMALAPLRGWLATGACALPVLCGVLIPVVSLFMMGQTSEQDIFGRRYVGFVVNSLTLASAASLVTVAAAMLIGSHHRLAPNRLSGAALYTARLGYAVPGGVIAVGLLVPFAAFDNALDAWMRSRFELSTGLLFTGSIWLLVGAYMIRFLAAAIGAYEGGIAAVSTSVDQASRTLGTGIFGTIGRVHIPLIQPSLLTAALIVFVDVMKELPATLIMRPFNYDTLAVQAYRLASDERLEGAAVPSLMIVALGFLPVIFLIRRMRRQNA